MSDCGAVGDDYCICCDKYQPGVTTCNLTGLGDADCLPNASGAADFAAYTTCTQVDFVSTAGVAAVPVRTCGTLASCTAPAVTAAAGTTTTSCPTLVSSSCDDATSCSERKPTECEEYSSQCECCEDSSADDVACLVDADCAASTTGATACGTPMLNGAPVPGGTSACVSPQLCGIETTFGTETATMSCGATKLALYVAAAAAAAYMAV